MTTHKKQGKVYLVGAGPGREDLITVRGAEIIKIADCVIYDKLANPALLKYTSANTEIIHVPKRIGDASFTQRQINKLLVDKASDGKTVVRLKGGDPCIFGRGAEEAALLAKAGIDFEIVPGVTAAIAAGSYAAVMLTDRNYSSQVLFVTGHEADDKKQSNIDWKLLAKFSGTIVFYMAMGNLPLIADRLIKNGMTENTPAAVIADATFPTQKIVTAPLGRIDHKCKQQKIGPPAVVVIGAAAQSDPNLNWFMKKPLFGKNIVITRDKNGNADFAAKIISRAANPIQFPTIKIIHLTQTNSFLKTLAQLANYEWIIFTSKNGVTVFFDCLQSLEKDARVFASAKIAAIGGKTAATLTRFGIRPDFVPTVFTGKELAGQLIEFTSLKGRKILLLRSQIASDELVDLLKQTGAKITEQPVYTIETEKNESAPLTEKISAGSIDWLTFTSPSSVNGFFEQIPLNVVKESVVKVASIGPVTSRQLQNLDVKVDVTATQHTIDGMLAAIEETYE
jgi:uroporphyrinogen III methyltransferase/synthase